MILLRSIRVIETELQRRNIRVETAIGIVRGREVDLLRAPISLIKNLGTSEAFLVIAERFLYVFTCIHVHIRKKSPVVSSFKKDWLFVNHFCPS